MNNVPVAVISKIDEKKVVTFVCSNMARYTFKFNKKDELEYCVYRDADMQETSDIEKIPDFEKALDMATNKYVTVYAKGK